LFLPQAWPSRFVFLAVILFSTGIALPGPFDWILIGPGWFFIAASVLLICFGIKVERGGGLFALLHTIGDTAETGIGDINPVWRFIWLNAGVMAIFAGMASLGFLVANGKDWKAAFYHQSHGALGWAEDVILLAVLWLVFGVPYQNLEIKLPKDGYAQRFLVVVIAAAAAALSGIYLFLVSLGGGPLGNVGTGALVVAIVFTTVLVAPFYRFLVRIVFTFADPTVPLTAWRRVTREIRAALDQPARDKGTLCNKEITASQKKDPDAAAASM
jgi:hypothetical protein